MGTSLKLYKDYGSFLDDLDFTKSITHYTDVQKQLISRLYGSGSNIVAANQKEMELKALLDSMGVTNSAVRPPQYLFPRDEEIATYYKNTFDIEGEVDLSKVSGGVVKALRLQEAIRRVMSEVGILANPKGQQLDIANVSQMVNILKVNPSSVTALVSAFAIIQSNLNGMEKIVGGDLVKQINDEINRTLTKMEKSPDFSLDNLYSNSKKTLAQKIDKKLNTSQSYNSSISFQFLLFNLYGTLAEYLVAKQLNDSAEKAVAKVVGSSLNKPDVYFSLDKLLKASGSKEELLKKYPSLFTEIEKIVDNDVQKTASKIKPLHKGVGISVKGGTIYYEATHSKGAPVHSTSPKQLSETLGDEGSLMDNLMLNAVYHKIFINKKDSSAKKNATYAMGSGGTTRKQDGLAFNYIMSKHYDKILFGSVTGKRMPAGLLITKDGVMGATEVASKIIQMQSKEVSEDAFTLRLTLDKAKKLSDYYNDINTGVVSLESLYEEMMKDIKTTILFKLTK